MAGMDESMYALELGQSAATLGTGEQRAVRLTQPAPVFALLTGVYWRMKRPIGFVLSLVLAAAASPALIAITLVLAYQGRPVFIRQRRLGQFGKPIDTYAFRTMVPDSVRALCASQGPEPAPMRDAFGRFLLSTRLDRLPLLWSVLKGDLNLIGPRPLSQEELIGSGRAARHTLSVRPGLTGLWWVQGEGDLKRRLALDRSYIEHAGPLVDLRILLLTLVLIHGGGLSQPASRRS